MERKREKSDSPVRTVSFNDTPAKGSSPQRYPGRHNIFTRHHNFEDGEPLDRHHQMDDVTVAFKKKLSTTEITGPIQRKKKWTKAPSEPESEELYLEEEAEDEDERESWDDDEEDEDEEEEEEEEEEAEPSVVEEFLTRMWERQEMCDLIIKVGKYEVLGHKIPLAAYSTQFEEQCIAEVPVGSCEITLSGTTINAVQEVMKYIYTNDIDLNSENIDAVISASRQLGVTDVIDSCKEYLLEFTRYNVLDHMWIAEKYEYYNICSSTFDYACKNIVKISNTESYLTCPAERVVRLLQNDNLNVKKELDVYKIATKWLDFNQKGRKKHSKEVLNTIRFPLIVPDDVVKNVEPNMKHYSDECNKMLIDVFRFHALRYSGGATDDFLPKQRQYYPVKYIEKETGAFGEDAVEDEEEEDEYLSDEEESGEEEESSEEEESGEEEESSEEEDSSEESESGEEEESSEESDSGEEEEESGEEEEESGEEEEESGVEEEESGPDEEESGPDEEELVEEEEETVKVVEEIKNEESP